MPAAKPHGISIRLRFEPFPNEPLIGCIADCLIGAVFGDVLAVAAGTEIHAAKIPVVKQKGFPFADLFCRRTERTIRRNHANIEIPMAIMTLATELSTADTNAIAMTMSGKAIRMSQSIRITSSSRPPL